MRFFIFFLIVCSPATFAESWKKFSYLNGCTVYDHEGANFKNFPGSFCVFLDDGSFLSGSESGLRRFGKNKEVLWEIKAPIHHQLNLSTDKQRILALSYAIEPTGKGKGKNKIKVRVDKFLVISLDGKILHEISAREIMTQAKLQPLNWATSPWDKKLKINTEDSHFNSIYEIPPQKKSGLPEYLKENNIIVNSVVQGIVILSPDLSKVLHAEKFPFSLDHSVHDVQVTPDGELLLYNNSIAGTTANTRASAIQKYDPVAKELRFEHAASPKHLFYSPACGGVQQLDEDIIVYSHILTGAYIYSTKSNTVIATIPGTSADTNQLSIAQQVKAIDLTEFLKHHK